MKSFYPFFLVLFLSSVSVQESFSNIYKLSGTVDKLISDQGEETYNFSISLSQWLFDLNTIGDDVELSMISPGGEPLPDVLHSNPNMVFIAVRDLTSTNVDATVAGTWTIEETLRGTVQNKYQFTVPTILGSSHFTPTPIITAPADGAIVGSVFELEYTNANESGFGVIRSQSPETNNLNPVITSLSPGHLKFSYAEIPGFSGVEIERLTVSNLEKVQDLLVVGINATADAAFSSNSLGGLAGLLYYRTHSPGISLTVVPEPLGTSLAITGIMLTCGTRGHRRRKRGC